MEEFFILILTCLVWYGIYRLFRKPKKEVAHLSPERAQHFNESVKALTTRSKSFTTTDCDTVITCILANITLFDDDDPAEQTIEDFRVAGITYHDFADADNGIVFGYAIREPGNEHDPNAIALYSWDDRQLGFIPRDQQDDFNDFTTQDCIPMICLIHTFINDEGDSKPSGEVTLYRGTEQSLTDILTHFYKITDKIPLL